VSLEIEKKKKEMCRMKDFMRRQGINRVIFFSKTETRKISPLTQMIKIFTFHIFALEKKLHDRYSVRIQPRVKVG